MGMGGCGIAIKKQGSPIVMLLMMEFSQGDSVTYAVRNETGIFILRYLARYTVLHLSIQITLPQAVGSEYFKNPS